jgi:selenide,water dikinase
MPLVDDPCDLARLAYTTALSDVYGVGVRHLLALAPRIAPVQQMLLTDPQTSGGLLVACAPDTVDEVLALFAREGFDHAAVIGEMQPGPAGVSVD